VWVLPFLLLLLGVFVAVRIVRKRSALVAGDDSVIESEDVTR
jgi:cytochrome c-type biogenesis protein CcmH/NrfF